MPSIREKNTKSGDIFYEIRVSRGRGKSYLTKRWYPPKGWSKRSIDRELAKVAAEFEQECHSGEILSRKEKKALALQQKQEAEKIPTLKHYGETVFMPAKAITASEACHSTYQGILNRWIYPAVGDIKLPDITAAKISALLLDIQSQGKSHATVIKIYTILHSLFKMAYMADIITRNPMDKVQRPKPRKDEIKGDTAESYTVEEVQHILSCLEQEPLKWQTFVRLLIDTGIRRGEACALRWENINFKAHTITIAGNLCYTPQKGVYLDTPKNGHMRTIDIAPEVSALLRQLRIQQADKAISAFVFTQENSPEPMHPQSPTRYLKKFSAKYNVPDLHPHKLRHTFASIAITSGADVASISEKLGHGDKAVTLRMYTHADQESMKRASEIFREALKQVKEG